MKTITFLVHVIACMTCLAFLNACQEFDSATDSVPTSPKTIALRQDCDNCDCHCFVELKNDNAASLELCGTCEGPLAGCSSSGDVCGNGSFTGDRHVIALSSTLNPRYDFCAHLLDDFYVRNTSSTDAAGITVSCTAQSGSPQTISFLLGTLTTQHVEVLAECQVATCP